MSRANLSPLFTWRSAVASPGSPLTPTQRHVALTLSLYMSERGDSCWPSMETLAGDSGRSLSTVRDSLKAMSELGWLERDTVKGRGRSNSYRAVIPVYFDPDAPAEENHRSAAVYADGGEGALSTAALMRDSATPPGGDRETAGDRRFTGSVGEIENHRSETGKPPVSVSKTTGDSHLMRQEDASECVILPDEPGESAATRLDLMRALGVALGVDLEKRTSRERRQWELACDDLVEVGASADDVLAHCAAYRQIWPDMKLTPLALVGHWSTLGAHVETARASGFPGWLAKAPTLFDRRSAHEVIDDTARIDDAERTRRHRLLDERFDAIESEAA